MVGKEGTLKEERKTRGIKVRTLETCHYTWAFSGKSRLTDSWCFVLVFVFFSTLDDYITDDLCGCKCLFEKKKKRENQTHSSNDWMSLEKFLLLMFFAPHQFHGENQTSSWHLSLCSSCPYSRGYHQGWPWQCPEDSLAPFCQDAEVMCSSQLLSQQLWSGYFKRHC